MNAQFSPPTVSAFSGNVAELPRARFRYQVTECTASWVDQVVERLNELCALPRGWDGYRGEPVSFGVAKFTFDMLNSIMWNGAPEPSLIPCGSGDLQVEWHLLSGDLELHVRAPNDVSASYEDANNPENVQELETQADFTAVAQWLRDLGERRALLTSAA